MFKMRNFVHQLPQYIPNPSSISPIHTASSPLGMVCFRRWRRALRSSSPPRRFHSGTAPIISQNKRIEEEILPDYDPEEFYPVHIGQTFQERYQILGKLGFGATSTVWFARDLRDHRYVSLKVYIRTPASHGRVNREVEAYQHLAGITTSHPGSLCIREVLDSFEIERVDGTHHFCLVHPPLHMTLRDMQLLTGKSKALPVEMVRGTLRYLLQALDFLHTEANITHCDIKASNLMLTIDDESMLEDFESAEQREPCPRKILSPNRTIYTSRSFRFPKDRAWGRPILCDFGEARIGRGPHEHEWIQPPIYRAPEIIMETSWSNSADIWSVGCMTWDLLENKHLFDGRDEESEYSNRHHIAEMVSYLGAPCLEFQQRSERSPLIFDESGNWKGSPPLPSLSLEASEEKLLEPAKMAYINCIKSMLTWLPEDRKSAKALLQDTWITEER